MKKRTFDAVAFARKRREEWSCAYAGLSVEQIRDGIRATPKDNPFWKQRRNEHVAPCSRKKTGGRPQLS